MKKSLLIVGGSGALGSSVLRRFRDTYKCVNISPAPSDLAFKNISIGTTGVLTKDAVAKIKAEAKKEQSNYDAIICTAGGFNGVKINDENFFAAYDQMMRMNVDPTLLCAHLATTLLKEKGALVLTGAQGVYKTQAPDILSYALAKNAVHSLAQNLSTSKALPQGASVITILPKTLDTPANREWMPEKDWKDMQRTEDVAELIYMWLNGTNRPANGSFVEFDKQKDGSLTFKTHS